MEINMKADNMTIDNKELNNGEATKEQAGQTPDTWQAYTKKTHVIGRTVSIITLVMLVGAPFLIGKLLGAYPDLGAVGKGFLSVGIVWLVSSIAEFLIYTPMLGAGGGSGYAPKSLPMRNGAPTNITSVMILTVRPMTCVFFV